MIFKRVVFYITNRHSYAMQAAVSAASVKKHDRGVTTWLFVDGLDVQKYEDRFDNVTLLDTDGKSLNDMWYFRQVMFMTDIIDRLVQEGTTFAIYMDCDTYVCSNFDDIWASLYFCDMMGVFSPRRWTKHTEGMGVPPCFSEYNIGFNPMKITEKLLDFWGEVQRIYRDNLEKFGNDDQHALRVAMWRDLSVNKTLKFLTLPPEYNCRFRFPISLGKDAVVLHGHTNDYSDVESRVNNGIGIRGFVNEEFQK